MYKTGRPSKWTQKTTAIRVPEAYAERLVNLAHWWDSGGYKYAPDLFTEQAEEKVREHLRRYTREALIDEIIAYRMDQDELYAQLMRTKNP